MNYRGISLILLLASIIGAYFTNKSNSNSEPELLTVDYANAKLCGASTIMKMDMEAVYTSEVPLAPRLETKWQTNLKISTTNEEAKRFFNQGLFNLYGFNHAEADRAFKEAIRLDPECAICHWGVALGLGPNINRPMPESHNEEAYKYMIKAKELSEGASDIEKALINALESRYVQNPPDDRSTLDANYANEMRLVTQQYRNEMDIATLFAESLMNLMPWKYWLPDDKPKLQTREAMSVLNFVLAEEPNHPGANHYYIHIVEEVKPELGISSADRLKNENFNSGHLIHMPSHIYIRTGRIHDATTTNIKAIKVDEDYIAQCNAQGVYPAAYYPHNIHFLWYAASMEGRGELTVETARKLMSKTPKGMLAKIPSLERYFTIPYLSLVRFGRWDDVLQEKAPSKNMVYATLMWHYARGMAYVKKGNTTKAETELEMVEEISKNEAITSKTNPYYPVVSMVKMAKLVLKAEIAGHSGEFGQKVKLLQEAVDIQDGLIYDEPPHFYYPIRQSLGAALLQNNDPATAEIVFREDLNKFPNNGWSLFGLQQSLTKQQKWQEANLIKKQFDQVWSHADVTLSSSVF